MESVWNPEFYPTQYEILRGQGLARSVVEDLELWSDPDFEKITARCREAGHLAIGIRRDGSAKLNVSGDTKVEPGDSIVTIGAERLGSI